MTPQPFSNSQNLSPSPPMSLPTYQYSLAKTSNHLRGYFDLRKAIFCDEQEIFAHSDIDRTDEIAHPIVALERDWVAGDRVIGIVRIYVGNDKTLGP